MSELDVILPPNMEALVSAFLRDQDEIADLIGDHVYTALPKPKAGADLYPLIRVTLLIDEPTGSPLWAIGYDMQIEAFGGSKDDAWRLAATARALLDQRLTGIHPEGVVNGVTNGGMVNLPDDSFSPAKPRYLFTSTVHAHPVGTVSS